MVVPFCIIVFQDPLIYGCFRNLVFLLEFSSMVQIDAGEVMFNGNHGNQFCNKMIPF